MDEIINEKEYKEKLKNQIVEAHGKVMYTYTAHHKMQNRMLATGKIIRLLQAFLTAISAGGFLATITTNQIELSWIGGVTATISLALNFISLDFKFETEAMLHKQAADELWDVKEQYESLLTDMDENTCENIVAVRNHLNNVISEVNKHFPGTDNLSFISAKKALKDKKEQTFTENEAEELLPRHLRN